jgi:hypothetical protein
MYRIQGLHRSLQQTPSAPAIFGERVVELLLAVARANSVLVPVPGGARRLQPTAYSQMFPGQGFQLAGSAWPSQMRVDDNEPGVERVGRR